MKLFQYAIIFNPSSKEKEKGQKARLISKITEVLANDQQAATLIAGRSIPEEYLDKLDQVEVAVRPF